MSRAPSCTPCCGGAVGVLLIPALAAGLLVGGQGALAAVGLALLVTLAFQPARARLERAVTRIVYRDRPRGYALLARFGQTLRAATGVGEVAPQLAEVVRSGLGASWAGAWIHVAADGGGALRSVAAAGIEPGPSVLLAPETSAQLRSSQATLTGDFPAELGCVAGDEPPLPRSLWSRARNSSACWRAARGGRATRSASATMSCWGS